ncbi:hypothetical protein nbrc107696_15920 [Gordonia spumicola]|uniref:ParD-like antitoxin of type II toxin-antitoxin system n=1 Tax=Gordonia spumicola TaxID=589161 RepID=A0A7I9V6X1_9ACTN|nr:hypothetical protein [Gordonia spumicola]GEE01146.1 hypothetical protein nbrc107696_15920 [Gordonia spumicola]
MTATSPRRASKKDADRATRFSAELFEAAQAVGEIENRSARQQLEHWASIGRALTQYTSASRSRVEAALAGKLAVEALNTEESIAFDAELAADIATSITQTDLAAAHASRGTAAVYMDENGDLVQQSPDGSTTPVGAP